jgi:hypothetical protein
MSNVNNKPGMTLSGKTWDAKHLDKFLNSEWGEKLYNHKKFDDPSLALPSSPFLQSSIRPSATFMSEPRDRKVASTIDKPQGSPLVTWSSKSKSPTRANLSEISSKMKEIEKEQKKAESNYSKLLSPSKRKQLFEAEKERLKKYSELKKARLEEVKNSRIVTIGYPEGILGVDSPQRPEVSPYYYKIQRENEKLSKSLAASRISRAMYIMNKTTASSQIQFFNEKNTEVPVEKPCGIKKVENLPIHYHDTHEVLFTPSINTVSPERSERLKNIWRGQRNFNIINGTDYENF